MSNIITQTSPAFDAIYNVASDLHNLAHAFSIMGNDQLAASLRANASLLDNQADAIRAAIGERINQDFKAAQENSATLLAAVMAGSKLRGES